MPETIRRTSHWTVAKVLLLFACFGALYLLVAALKDGPLLGCGTGSSCDTVLKSRFAYFLPGVPVSAPALFTYVVLLIGLFRARNSDAWRGVVLVASLLIIGAAIWFIGLQAFIIGKFCPWCMGTHVFAALGAGAALLGMWPIQAGLLPVGLAAAAIGLGSMAGLQYFFPQKTTQDSKISAGLSGGGEEVVVAGIKIGLNQVPYHGNPNAERGMVLLFDYTCSSCRRMHKYLNRAEERYGDDQFLVVMLPVPLNPDCNRHFDKQMPDHRNACLFAKMAFALWSIDHEKFFEFDRWMVDTGTSRYAPEADAARAKAEELVGKAALDAALASPAVAAKIEQSTGIWNRMRQQSGQIAMPKILWNNNTMTEGATSTEFEFYDLLESKLGVRRKD